MNFPLLNGGGLVSWASADQELELPERRAFSMATSGELTESDIPGAILEEPLEKATIHALKWWLLCRGIKAPSSWRKAKLIER